MAQKYATAAGFLLGLAENGVSDTDLEAFAGNPALMRRLAETIHALRVENLQERSDANRHELSDRNADITILGLGVPLTAKLRRDGFQTVGWLTKVSAAGLTYKGYSTQVIERIAGALKRYGLELRQSPDAVFPSPQIISRRG